MNDKETLDRFDRYFEYYSVLKRLPIDPDNTQYVLNIFNEIYKTNLTLEQYEKYLLLL